ncbi:hypothetical protein GGD54_002904 [Rhizobium tropici]|nr:hypothetical protein [Rhizobium tropici]
MDIASILAAGKANVFQLIVRQSQKRIAVPALDHFAYEQTYKVQQGRERRASSLAEGAGLRGRSDDACGLHGDTPSVASMRAVNHWSLIRAVK